MPALPKSRLGPSASPAGCCAQVELVEKQAIAVVEDDSGMREALQRILRAAGFVVRGYGSAEEFLGACTASDLGCLVADLHLPGASGLDLQRRLVEKGRAHPVIFITAHDTVTARREADALGAVAFLVKPFEGRLLLNAVQEALS
jgi:two-component system, LuxR family, response regulator FixJ